MPVRNALLGWGYNDLHILSGDTPPPGGNLSRKSLYAGLGTFDGRSVAPWRDYAIWANAAGIWKSDGSTLSTRCSTASSTAEAASRAEARPAAIAAGTRGASTQASTAHTPSVARPVFFYVPTLTVSMCPCDGFVAAH